MLKLMRATTLDIVKMNLISIWTAILVVLSIYGSSGAAPSSGLVKLASYQIVKKPVHIVSDKFLSFTADPNTISHVTECSLTNATLNMAKSLTPAYFRLAGIDSNRFVFHSNPNINNTELNSKSKIFSVSSTEWLKVNNFLSEVGMNVVACVSGQTESTNEGWDLSNALELITYSDKHNISLDWQLGYELQNVASLGKLMGRDVTRLRKILDVFPRYRDSLIIGPDMTSFKNQKDAIFVRNYLAEAADSLNVFTWHPFSRSGEDDEILEMLANGMNSMDTYLWIKEGLLKSSSRGVVPKKSIWIAESENTETVSNLTDSMTWIMRMGAAAKLGASVYLRKPHLLSFYEPTPEYWTAVLYKSLVGRTVLDIKQTSGNGTNKVHIFSHCTKFIDKPDESVINPEIDYDPGSITVYGVNMASESTRLSFKIGYKGDETAHLYVLTEDTSGDFPKTLLNKQPLGLSADYELPLISPRIRESPKYLIIPGRSIFFVVFPNTKCRSCNDFDSPDTSKSKIQISEEEDPDTNIFSSNGLEEMENENDHDNEFVSYPKRAENVPQTDTDSGTSPSEVDQSKTQTNVKYVTFSDETWLNNFPEKLKEVVSKEKNGPTLDPKDMKKVAMYRALAQAMLGKRRDQNIAKEAPQVENPSTRFLFEDNSESNQFKRVPSKSLQRIRRDLELESVPENKTESQKELEETFVGGKNDETSLKSVSQSQSSPANKTEIEEDPEGFFDDDEDEEISSKSVSGSSSIDEINVSESLALYLFDGDNEARTSETTVNSTFPKTYSKISAVLLNNDNLEQAMNSTDWNQTIPIFSFVQRSTLENILKEYSSRIKREVTFENITLPEKSENSNDSTQASPQTSPNEELPSVGDLLNNIMDNVAKLIQKYSGKSEQNFASSDIMNKTKSNFNRLLTQAMLSKLTTPNLPKELSKFENPATKFDLDNDIQSIQFQEALKNFDRFKRSSLSNLESRDDLLESFMESNEMTEPEQKIIKREGNSEPSPIMKSPVDMDSPNIALYLFDQQDEETRSSETEKRSINSKIFAVPLDEDNVQMAIQSEKFGETIPIITFVKKPILKDIVEAAKERVKREAPKFENSTLPELSNYLTASSTPASGDSPNQPDNRPIPQLTTSQIPPKDDNLIKYLTKEIIEEAEKIIQQFSQNDTKDQSDITQKENLRHATFSPELIKESDSSEVSRELREVDDVPKSVDNAVGVRHLKTIDKSNVRPVSPFPKKPKNVKSKSAKNIKPKSTDNVQLNHQNTPSTFSTERALSSKRSTPQISSNKAKSAHLIENPITSHDPEDDLDEDSSLETKFLSAISKNLQLSSSQPEIKQSKSEEVSSKAENPSSPEHIPKSPQNKPATHPPSTTVISETVGKPQKKPSLADLARKVHARQTNKPKITPEQLLKSYEQKRKELLQKHIARLNELRNLIGITAVPESHLHKRDAGVLDDWYREGSSVVSEWWQDVRDWDPKKSWIAEEAEKITEMIIGRNKRQNDEDITEQYPSSALEIFKNYRLKRNSDIVVTPRILKENPLKQQRDIMKARLEEKRRQDDKISQEKKAMKAHPRHRRDLEQTIEKAKEWKEKTQTRVNESRQKLAKRIEEMKQKRPHVPKANQRNKRDSAKILDKIHDLKEQTQARNDELVQKVTKRVEELKQKLARHESIIRPRNKRDVQAIQDKIQELRKKKEERRQELHKKPEPELPVEQPVTSAPANFKTKPSKIEENPVKELDIPAPTKLKTKPTKIEENPVDQPATPAPSKVKTKLVKIDEPRHQVNRTSKKSHKSLPIKEKPNLIHKREVPENQRAQKVTSPSDLQKDLKFHLFVDPELNTPQSMLEDGQFEELDRLKRSITDNEIFDDDYEIGAKIKNKDNEDVNGLLHESSTSTSNPLINKNIGDSRIKSNVGQNMPSQENQICELTNYNVFKYFLCVAHRLWYSYFTTISTF